MAIPLYVAFTVDCERIAAESPPGGPESWAMSERAIRGICETLRARGARPTLFFQPECAVRHASLVRDLIAEKAEPGLHLHPEAFGDGRYNRPLGAYGADEQRSMLAEARDRVAEAIGGVPTSFRAGNFSASRETFPILVDLGFRQGSTSDPGRDVPQWSANWVGADCDPHWASADDPCRAGRLPFLEVPVTTDPAWKNRGAPPELRIERGTLRDVHAPIIERSLARMATEGAPFRTLCIMTHNIYPYDDLDAPVSRTLADVLDHLDALRASHTYDVVFATLAELRDRYVRAIGEPA